jgi:ribonuclease BN (tRNA processing enzyme)
VVTDKVTGGENMLKVKILGAGSAFAKQYKNTSFIVDYDNGYRLLVDCGHTVPAALRDAGIPISTIDGVLITHTHADHVGGLEELALSNRYIFSGRRLDLWVPYVIQHELWEHSLKGGLEFTDEGICTIDDYFVVKDLFQYQVNSRDLGLQIYPTNHVKNKDSFAVSFQDRLFYSGDTKFSPSLIELAKDYQVIIHDCQLFKGGVHASLEELLTLDEEIQRKMYLIHYGDNAEDFVGKTGRMRFATEGTTYLI